MPENCILDPGRDCLGLIKAKELEADLNELRRENSISRERIFDRLGMLEKRDAVQEEQYKTILSMLDSLSSKVGALEAKPAKRWENLVEKAIWAVAAAAIAFLLARIGL